MDGNNLAVHPFRRWILLVIALGCANLVIADPRAKIVLIAGPITGHPKEAHEYEKVVILLKDLLETSPSLAGKVLVETHFQGWPADPTTLDDADTIVLVGDGGDHREQDHPLYNGDRFAQFSRQMQRGCGAVFLHWTTFHPSRVHDQITEWVGGYFDYETGPGANHWYSAIQTWKALATPTEGLPITRGVHPWTAPEEFYYRMKFRGPDPANVSESDRDKLDPRLRSVLVTRPPNETNDFTVAWSVERENGGRGFGTTGGHFYANYWQPDFRRMVLNAIAWSAKLEVPASGIQSAPMERFRTLIVTGANHPAHDWNATTAALLLVLEQDPRAQVDVVEDPEELAKSDRLDPYDLVVWNYVNWERPGLSAGAKQNFLAYLHRGGGLALIHFGGSAFHPSLQKTKPEDAWPEFHDHIARRVWEHRPPNISGHDSYGPFHVEIPPTGHPITEGLSDFETHDELYFHQAGSDPIIPLANALSKVTHTNEPLAWTYIYDQARVFQTVLGHSEDSIREAAALIRRGCIWASGHDPLSFDPPASLTTHALWRDGSPWKPHPAAKKESDHAAGAAPAPAIDPNAGVPAISGREPGVQQERDWVDNRWQKTDVGPFLASALPTPEGVIARALSIRIGEQGEGAIAYDTVSGAPRAMWLGGFLKFEAGRFGLIGPPKPDAELRLHWAAKVGWADGNVRFSGQHLNGKRIVLEYEVHGIRVFETPWIENTAAGPVWTRSFEIAPSKTELSVFAGALPGPTAPEKAALPGNISRIASGEGDSRIVLAAVGLGADAMGLKNAECFARIPPHAEPLRFKLLAWQGNSGGVAVFDKSVAGLAGTETVSDWVKPGPARWLPELKTVGEREADRDFLTVDTITVPYQNPWNALFFCSGVDFTSDGAAYVCTIHGDVWKVTGVDRDLRSLSWHRFATGLYQPLGLKVRNDEVFVLGRDRITRLLDLNHDGEADSYETFCDLIKTSTGGHDYVTSLETDDSGNFYYVDPNGVHRVSPDGRTQETLATGFRNPNGLGVRPDGAVITVAPQQGTWTPSSVIHEIKVGGYYGYGGPKVTPERPLGYDAPLCWIPHGVDNSSGGQVWVPANTWGPLGGQMLHLLWGRCGLMLAERDVVDGAAQGAVVPLPVKFLSGPNRGVFNKADGNLYIAGSTGWQTSALKDGCFQRVRYTGKPVNLPLRWRTRANGLEITFSEPLDKTTASDPESYSVHQWNYRYAQDYGSKDWSVSNPSKEGRDTVPITSARLLDDGKTVFLEIPSIKPVMQMEVKYNVDTAIKKPAHGSFWLSVNRLPAATN